VAELSKSFHTPCLHQTGTGCGVYAERPADCKDYRCLWLQGQLPEELRPDRCGILVDAEGGDEWLVIQECRPGALSSPVGCEIVRQLSSHAGELRGGVKIDPHGAHRQSGTLEQHLPGQYQEIAPKVFLYRGLHQPGILPTGKQPTRGLGTGRNNRCPCGSGRKYKLCCRRG